MVDARGGQSFSPPDDSSVRDMLAVFRRGSTLVDVALSTLAALAPQIEALKVLVGSKSGAGPRTNIGRAVLSLGVMLDAANADGDNLLLSPKGRAAVQPLVVFILSRQASGALSVQSIEIDRAAIVLSDGAKRESALTYDRLFKASLDLANPHAAGSVKAFEAALDAFRIQISRSGSRLSIAKARFDLQSSFLNAITQAGAVASPVRLESSLNTPLARDMALEAKRLLGGQPMNIANGNRETLRGLLQKHAAKA